MDTHQIPKFNINLAHFSPGHSKHSSQFYISCQRCKNYLSKNISTTMKSILSKISKIQPALIHQIHISLVFSFCAFQFISTSANPKQKGFKYLHHKACPESLPFSLLSLQLQSTQTIHMLQNRKVLY